MFQVTSLSVTLLIFHCAFCSEVKIENVTDLSSGQNILSDGSKCVTTYERVEHVVHDTVYQHQCSEYHVPQCNVTHVAGFKDALETRCTPGQSQSQSWITEKINWLCAPIISQERPRYWIDSNPAAFNSKCKQVRNKALKKECKMEYKAECFQVMVQVKTRWWGNYNLCEAELCADRNLQNLKFIWDPRLEAVSLQRTCATCYSFISSSQT